MKKIIIICLLALSYTSTQAQEPTKQETMDWIASKMKLYIASTSADKRYFVSYEQGVFTYKKNISTDDGEPCGYVLFHIYLPKVTKISTQMDLYKDRIDNIVETFDRLIVKGNKLVVSDESNVYRCEKNDIFEANEIEMGNFGYYADSVPLFNFNLESGLRARAIKAFEVLIKYNTIKGVNEKF